MAKMAKSEKTAQLFQNKQTKMQNKTKQNETKQNKTKQISLLSAQPGPLVDSVVVI